MRCVALLLAVQAVCASPALAADAGNAQWNQAQQLYQSGDYNRALPALTALDKAFPSNAKLHYMIGMCYKNLGKQAQAQRELTWVSSYAPDAALKQAASTALTELQVGEAQQKAKSTVIVPAPADPLTSLVGSMPPSKNLVNDSVSQTIEAAAKKGYKPCTNVRCLNYSKPGWQHMKVPGKAPTDIWMKFESRSSSPGMSFSQWHIGDIIETPSDGPVRDSGPCQTCMGSGWLKK